MNRHYLRAYLFDKDGKLLPPLMKNPKVSTALLPVMKLPGMKRYAEFVAEASDKDRRAATVDVLVEGQKQRKVVLYGLGLVSCPIRRYAGATATYAASFAAIGMKNQIWAGDVSLELLADMVQYLRATVKRIRTEQTGNLDTRIIRPVAL